MEFRTREEARREINRHTLTEYINLEKSKGGNYVCPVCGSGTHEHKTGALKVYKERAICFNPSCELNGNGNGQDTLGALRVIWRDTEAGVFDRLNITIKGETAYKATEGPRTHETAKGAEDNPKAQKAQEGANKKVIHAEFAPGPDFYKQAHEALMKTPNPGYSYLQARGITPESMERFNLGYCPAWIYPFESTAKKEYKSRRVIIPRSNGTYNARVIDEGVEPKKMIAGSQGDLFTDKAALKDAVDGGEPVIIVEGELDAISLMQIGYGAVIGIGATTNIKKFAETAEQANPDICYLIALDNDEDKTKGPKAAEMLGEYLEKAGRLYIKANEAEIYGSCKDANEAYIKNGPEALANAIYPVWIQAGNKAAEAKEERRRQLYATTGAGMVDDFLQAVQTTRFKPLRTGVSEIDDATEGGLLKQSLLLIGGAPGAGKTTFCTQLFESMAAAGNDIIYFNLEMSREQMIAKSLSRAAYELGERNISAAKVLKGYEWTDAQRNAILAAAENYKAKYARHIRYNPPGTNKEIDKLITFINEEGKRATDEGKAAPIIVIDYLHLLIGRNGEETGEALKRAISGIKDYALKYDTIAAAIMAYSKTDAEKDSEDISIMAGRDTGALAYTADYLIALTKEKEQTERGAYKAKVKILKQRLGEAPKTINYIFNGAANIFLPASDREDYFLD